MKKLVVIKIKIKNLLDSSKLKNPVNILE